MNLLQKPKVILAMVCISGALFGGGIILFALDTNNARRDLCASIDADHNRERADIIAGHKVLYHPPFNALAPTAEAQQKAYDITKHRYESVRKTRPPFCDQYGSNPVKPFPTIESFRHDLHPH